MKEQLIQEVQRQMLPYLNNAQLKQLQGVLEGALSGIELSHSAGMIESEKVDTVACFINAKRIEGCSEKTLSYDILKAVAKKYEFEYPDDKMIELSKRIKLIVDDKAKYTDWSTRDDIKANLQVDLILLLDEFDYPPVTIDDVYKEVLEQAENFKKYSE